MRRSSDGAAYTLSRDPRVTRAGYWLRRLKVDELPQLWNVLRGEMSLVGPRPVVPQLAEEFAPAYTRLLEARPGLTDPASIKYCHEDECLALVPDQLLYYKTVLIPDKLRLSAAYLEHANLWTDLCLLVETVLVLVPDTYRPRLLRALSSPKSRAPGLLFPDAPTGVEPLPLSGKL